MESMVCVSILSHRGLKQQIYQWKSGRLQSEVSAMVSIAMSSPRSAGYFSANDCRKPNDNASILKRTVFLISL